MEALKKLARRVKNRAESAPMKAAGRAKILRLVEKLNTKGQLFLGFDAAGRLLESIGGPYAESTINYKLAAGQPVDRVTLKDTGEFYKSFRATAQKDGILIEADTIKQAFDGGTDLQDRWGNDLVGLTEDSLQALRQAITPLLIKEINKLL